MLCAAADLLRGIDVHLSHDFGRRTEDQRVVRKLLAFRHVAACADVGIALDPRAIQDDALDPDQRVVTH